MFPAPPDLCKELSYSVMHQKLNLNEVSQNYTKSESANTTYTHLEYSSQRNLNHANFGWWYNDIILWDYPNNFEGNKILIEECQLMWRIFSSTMVHKKIKIKKPFVTHIFKSGKISAKFKYFSFKSNPYKIPF